MMKIFWKLILTLLLLISSGYISAEEIVKEGTESGTSISSGTWNIIPLEENTFVMSWEQKGVNLDESGGGPFHNSSGNCAGISIYVSGVGSIKGYCVFIAPDGDKYLAEVTEENSSLEPGLKKGRYKYIGGTGKFAGIEGEGEYTYYNVQPAAEKTYQQVSKAKGSYKLP
jgi:hypothetical protein